MTSAHQTTTEAAITVNGLGSSGTAQTKILFSGSPIYDGTLTEARLKEIFTALVLAPVVNDGGHTFGVFNRGFANAPDLRTVEVGGGGKPGTPYAPNVASPAANSGINVATIPAAGADATAALPHDGGYGVGDGLSSPSDTSRGISTQNQTLGSLIFGKSYSR